MPETVTVASKLPHGLRIQAQRPIQANEPIMGGGYREVTRHEFYGPVVILNGTALPNNPVNPIAPYKITGGFALTPNVDAELFESWMEQNAEHPAVAGGFIFASSKMADVIDHTKAGKDELSGFEPTDPDKLPTEFKRTIKTAA